MAETSNGIILITGATGYVGGQIVREALEKGHQVRMAVRSAASGERAVANFPEHAAQLSWVIVSDFTKAESFQDVFEGVTGIVHSASPLVLSPEDNVRDLLEPAIQGSLAILEAAERWGTAVKRIVATSSFASISDVSKGKREDYTYNEKDWNPMTYEKAAVADGVTAYCASKALAERAMWDWVEQHRSSFTLVTICPPWVFGPYARQPKSTAHLSESVSLLWDVVSTKKIPPFDFGGCADSRDVAAAHIRALEAPEAAGQRFLVGHNFRYQLAVDAGRAAFPELGLPEGRPGYVEPAYDIDGSKATRILGIQYRPLEETARDMYGQLIKAREIEQAA